MRADSLFYRYTYRFGSPRWDSAEPPSELEHLIDALRPGCALDLGCGTGASAIYLGRRGWDVVGVDFVPEAIATAKARAVSAGSSASFVVGDVTHLREAGVTGPFDLLIDIGCYHAIPEGLRDAYAAEVTAVARPGADFYLAGIVVRRPHGAFFAPKASARPNHGVASVPRSTWRRSGLSVASAARRIFPYTTWSASKPSLWRTGTSAQTQLSTRVRAS